MSDIRTQLKNIIRESVKQCLIELHWKTWDAASKKAKGERARRFANKRDEEFNGQFGHSRSGARKFANGANEINRMKNAEYIKVTRPKL